MGSSRCRQRPSVHHLSYAHEPAMQSLDCLDYLMLLCIPFPFVQCPSLPLCALPCLVHRDKYTNVRRHTHPHMCTDAHTHTHTDTHTLTQTHTHHLMGRDHERGKGAHAQKNCGTQVPHNLWLRSGTRDEERAPCKVGAWPEIEQRATIDTHEWTSEASAKSRCSPRHAPAHQPMLT